MLNSYYTDDINNNKIPEELIESYDEVIKKPIDERFKKYEKYFTYHEVSDELREWLTNEFKSNLLTGKEKFYYWVIKDMPMFVNNVIQEVNFYPLQFDNTLRFWNQWYENERIGQTRVVEDKEAELCKFKVKPELRKWTNFKVDEIHDLKDKTPVYGVVAYD